MKVTVWHAVGGQLVRRGRGPATPPPPAPGQMLLGMYNSCAVSGTDGQAYGGNTAANWKAIRDAYMDPARVTVARVFNSGMPASWAKSAGKPCTDLGFNVLLSVKAKPQDVLAGTHDAAITALAAGAPAGQGFCFFHEPENDIRDGAFTALQWAGAFKRFHQRIKAANPTAWTAASHMSYQWGAGLASTAKPGDYSLGGDVDVICADTYFQEFETGKTSVDQDSRHMRWHNWAKDEGPLGMTEFGIIWKFWNAASISFTRPYTDAQRATLLANSLDWFYENQYRMVLYWNSWHIAKGDAGYRDDNLTPTKSDPEAAPRSLAAWNDRVAAWGTTGSRPPA